MGLRNKCYRQMTAPAIVLEFARIIPHAYINKPRDAAYVKRVMENNAIDAIDILWAIVEYSQTSGAHDIPTFCRWVNRNMEMFDGDRLAREGMLAESVSHQRLPIATLAYYDLMYETIPDVRLEQSWRAARLALRSYVATILGPA